MINHLVSWKQIAAQITANREREDLVLPQVYHLNEQFRFFKKETPWILSVRDSASAI